MTTPEPVQILLVEDSSDDVLLTRKALRRARIVNELHVARDGDEAMRLLRSEDPEVPRPDLVLLDLNLPGKDGREVLEDIKGDPALRRIPVVVLTTSAEERDILRAYDAHVNAFVTKPLGFDEFIEAVHSIEEFWLRLVKLPRDVPVS